MSIVKNIWGGWVNITYFLFARVSILLLLIIGFYWTVVVFANLQEDTTSITNTAFAITATLTALSFSCARAITGSTEVSDQFTYSGERFFHGALILLSASLLKYAYLSAQSSEFVNTSGVAWNILSSVIGVMVGVLFFWALSSAHGGLLVLNNLLWTRYSRHPKWDDLM